MTGSTTPTTPAAPAPERQVWLVRHGETEWARLGRHTGRTDIPLTGIGRSQAGALGRRLDDHAFALVLTSPLARAADTARLAGFGALAQADPDLMEWDYGALEGRLTAEIRAEYPDWSIWTGPWPAGETIDEVAARADRVIERCLAPVGRRRCAALQPRPPAPRPRRPLARPARDLGRAVRALDRDRLDPRLGPGPSGHRDLERGLPPRRAGGRAGRRGTGGTAVRVATTAPISRANLADILVRGSSDGAHVGQARVVIDG